MTGIRRDGGGRADDVTARQLHTIGPANVPPVSLKVPQVLFLVLGSTSLVRPMVHIVHRPPERH
jgi:hypothetical protein